MATSTYNPVDMLTARKYTGQSTQLRFDYAYTNRDELAGVTRYSDLNGTLPVQKCCRPEIDTYLSRSGRRISGAQKS